MLWRTLGFENIKKYFEKAAASDSLEHAYLFSGQEMIGKRTFALELSFYLATGFLSYLGTPLLSRINPDLFLFDGNAGIDEIRKLKSFLSLKPYSGKYKIAIINDAHQMGHEAANAMLKVLEEPPAHSLIILVSANPQALLPTIYSRCVEIKFTPHPRSELLKHLAKLGLNQEQTEFLADFSNGRLGLAYRLKESDSFKNIKKHLEDFNRLLRINLNDRFKFAEKVLVGGSEQVSEVLLYWLFYLRSDYSKKLEINRAKILRNILETRRILSHSQFNHRLALENLLINL